MENFKYGCKKEIKDRRDYKAKLVSSVEFPEEFRLDMPKVKNQGMVNSCVAHSLSTFLERYFNDDFSVGFIYGYRPEGYSQDEGMYPREALKTLQKVGDVKNNIFDYNEEVPKIIQMVNEKKDYLIDKAQDFKIESYARIYSVNEIKKCIYSGTPVPISIPIYDGMRLDENGTILEGKEIDGYHMMIACGWDKNGILLQNSWGKNVGITGFVRLPFFYKIDSAWAISMKNNKIETKVPFLTKITKILKKITNFLKKYFQKIRRVKKC